MDPAAVDELREDLDALCAEVLSSIPRRAKTAGLRPSPGRPGR
ncbi:hypothetical protein [Streptomonospora alba]|nr:hypothetical protein [Streptomonospora alba]